jgi:nucleotide-binding universal stress UspA family protein
MLVATDGSPSSKKALQFMTKQFTAKPAAKPFVILLVHVMSFLRYTMVKEAGEQLLAQEAAKLEKVGYRVRQFSCGGAGR